MSTPFGCADDEVGRQICASGTDTEGRDMCQRHIECNGEEVSATLCVL